MRKNTRSKQIFNMTIIAMLIGIEAIFCFVPILGSIQIGPVVATLAMLPVVIVACIYGPMFGGILGFVAGLFSFIVWTFIDNANPSAMMFTPWNAITGNYHNYWTIVICFVPRILTGVFAGLINKYLNPGLVKLFKVTEEKTGAKTTIEIICYAIACVVGSLTNTFLVLFGTYFLWGKDYALYAGMDFSLLLGVILTIVGTNGIFESVVCGIIGTTVAKSLSVVAKQLIK